MSKSAFIVHGARTPFARAGTDFTGVSAVDLGRTAAVEAMARAGVEPAAIDQAIFGNIATPVDAANIARIIALRAGVPKEKPAHSVSRNCASGIESVVEAARLIATGEADVVLAGGVENMTQIPFLYRNGVKEVFTKAGMSKTAGQRMSALSKMPWKDLFNPVIGLKEGLTDPVCDLGMGDTAEILAKEGHLTREAAGHLRAALAPPGVRGPREAGRGDRPRARPAGLRPRPHVRQRRAREPDDGGSREAPARSSTGSSERSRRATPPRSRTAARPSSSPPRNTSRSMR